MLERCAGRAGATESAVGWLPRPADLDTRGLDVGADALAALLSVDAALWRKELAELREYLGRYGRRLPAALLAELDSTERRLARARGARAPRRAPRRRGRRSVESRGGEESRY